MLFFPGSSSDYDHTLRRLLLPRQGIIVKPNRKYKPYGVSAVLYSGGINEITVSNFGGQEDTGGRGAAEHVREHVRKHMHAPPTPSHPYLCFWHCGKQAW